jgi:hypothetical protein
MHVNHSVLECNDASIVYHRVMRQQPNNNMSYNIYISNKNVTTDLALTAVLGHVVQALAWRCLPNPPTVPVAVCMFESESYILHHISALRVVVAWPWPPEASLHDLNQAGH